mgnify:CR=1 FL=1
MTSSQKRHLTYWEAVAVIVGTVVGAGILGIPYAVAQVGFFVGLGYIVGLGLVVLSLHILLGAVSARTKESSQLAGMAGKYLGKPGKILMSIAFFLGTYGALLAYIIGQGEVLQALFGGSSFVWSLLFFAMGSVVVYRGLKTVKVAELIMMSILLVAAIVISIWGAPSIELSNLAAVGDWKSLLLPYGVVLFAFHGSAAIPVAEELVRDQKRFKKVILLGGLIPIVLYVVFAAVVVGVTGSATTEVATVGLGEFLGPAVLLFGNVFAFFAMGTSFIMLGTAMRETYEWDFRVRPSLAWIATIGVPLALFVLGLRSFVQVISIAGALFISLEAILIVLMYWKSTPKSSGKSRVFALPHAALLSALLLAIFAGAAALSVASLIL